MRAAAVKYFLAAIFAATVAGLGTATPASAATPCWKAVINDWFDGQIDHVYPQWCYQQALGHLPTDVAYYSDAKDAITAAMRDAARQHKKVDYNPNDPKFGGGPGGGSTPGGGGPESGGGGAIQRVIGWLGPSKADAVPLPLLILAAVALLLLAAAGGSVLSKRLQARRLPPPNS
jgi:uncharacterized membrane protein YgcG